MSYFDVIIEFLMGVIVIVLFFDVPVVAFEVFDWGLYGV